MPQLGSSKKWIVVPVSEVSLREVSCVSCHTRCTAVWAEHWMRAGRVGPEPNWDGKASWTMDGAKSGSAKSTVTEPPVPSEPPSA